MARCCVIIYSRYATVLRAHSPLILLFLTHPNFTEGTPFYAVQKVSFQFLIFGKKKTLIFEENFILALTQKIRENFVKKKISKHQDINMERAVHHLQS